jgi:hypothetical protein
MWNSTNRREPMFLFYKCTFLSTPYMCIAMWKMWPPILLISTKWTTTPHLLITEHNVSVDIYCVNSITIPLYYFVTLGSKREFRDPCNLPRWVLDSPFSVVTHKFWNLRSLQCVFWTHQHKLLQVSLGLDRLKICTDI